MYREHQPRIVTSYSEFEVIDDMPPENTVAFLEQCFPQYIGLNKRFKFVNVTNIYTTVRSGGFIETRCLAAFLLIEYLAKKASKTLNNWLKAIIQEYSAPITDEEIKSFMKLRNNLVHEMHFMPGSPQE